VVLLSKVNVIGPQDRCRDEVVFAPYHQPTWQYAQGSIQYAHIYVQLEDLYILSLKKGLCKGDDSDVVGA